MIPPEVRTHGTVHNEPFRKLVHLLTEREPEKLTGTLNDKIRDEIEQRKVHEELGDVFKAHNVAIDSVLQIIDKYRGDKDEIVN